MQLYELTTKNREDLIAQAVRSINFGRLVIARADTGYAILGLPTSKRALDELKRIKNGRLGKMYSVFAKSKKDALELIPEKHKTLASSLFPGEVTLVYNRRKPGVRYIRKKTVNDIVSRVGESLTATSANPSDMPPARTKETMRDYFGKHRVMVLYEGEVPECLPSTVIDISGEKVKVIRQGNISLN
ncbi:MAG TPA: Sua5/YciO/YrdC/YwlC family protein [bacterium]|jgi:L-threonylcarbamoyladenylate synthase|nr:Sua5/YciO/YrdC/YwlC family protein [bacterium]